MIYTIYTTQNPELIKMKSMYGSDVFGNMSSDEEDFAKHIDYIHYNPVKHEYVHSPMDWKWSTFHNYVNQGWYDKEWGANEPLAIRNMNAGE